MIKVAIRHLKGNLKRAIRFKPETEAEALVESGDVRFVTEEEAAERGMPGNKISDETRDKPKEKPHDKPSFLDEMVKKDEPLGQGQGQDTESDLDLDLEGNSRSELYRLAKDLGHDVKWPVSKEELLESLSGDDE
jgi:hypothetical protein